MGVIHFRDCSVHMYVPCYGRSGGSGKLLRCGTDGLAVTDDCCSCHHRFSGAGVGAFLAAAAAGSILARAFLEPKIRKTRTGPAAGGHHLRQGRAMAGMGGGVRCGTFASATKGEG